MSCTDLSLLGRGGGQDPIVIIIVFFKASLRLRVVRNGTFTRWLETDTISRFNTRHYSVHCCRNTSTPLPISFPHHIEIKPKSKQTDRLFSTLHSVTMCGMTMAEPANCSIKSVYARAAKKRSECQTDRQPTASQRSNRGG